MFNNHFSAHGTRFVCLTIPGPFLFFRTSIPLFFCLMCLYLLPVITAGPDFPSFMNKVYDEISEHWWDLLLQVRNFYTVTKYTVMPHLWYISADFQAFLISLPTFLLLRRWKVVAIGAFLSMSIFACGIATWQIAGTDLPPFLIIPTESPILLLLWLRHLYRHGRLQASQAFETTSGSRLVPISGLRSVLRFHEVAVVP